MSGANSLQAQLGERAGSPRTRRDPLTAAELGQARDWRRMGASFDAIGKMLGRSGADVREALPDAPAPRSAPVLAAPPPLAMDLPPAPAPPRVRPPRVRAGSYELASLYALVDDAAGLGLTGGAVGAVIGRPQVSALAMLAILARKGFVARSAASPWPCWRRPKWLWRATDAGRAEAARHRGRP